MVEFLFRHDGNLLAAFTLCIWINPPRAEDDTCDQNGSASLKDITVRLQVFDLPRWETSAKLTYNDAFLIQV
jgi:hypothetical protein